MPAAAIGAMPAATPGAVLVATLAAMIARPRFPGVRQIHGVNHGGERVWFAASNELHALDPASGQVRVLEAARDAGTAFDGKHLFQIANRRIHKIIPETGGAIASIPAPGNGDDAGLAWADGPLWVGQSVCHRRDLGQLSAVRTRTSEST